MNQQIIIAPLYIRIYYFEYIIEYANPKDLVKFLRVCGRFYGLVQNKELMKQYMESFDTVNDCLDDEIDLTTKELQIDETVIQDCDRFRSLCFILKLHKNIETLNLYKLELRNYPENMQYLSEALKVNSAITVLDLYANDLGTNPENIKYLSEAFKVNSAIT